MVASLSAVGRARVHARHIERYDRVCLCARRACACGLWCVDRALGDIRLQYVEKITRE